jgi:hypothetical protein
MMPTIAYIYFGFMLAFMVLFIIAGAKWFAKYNELLDEKANHDATMNVVYRLREDISDLNARIIEQQDAYARLYNDTHKEYTPVITGYTKQNESAHKDTTDAN